MKNRLINISGFVIFLIIWQLVFFMEIFPEYALPSPIKVFQKSIEEFSKFRIYNDIIVSIWRVAVGFSLASFIAIPFGLLIGQSKLLQDFLIPVFNFFRFLSPLSWIPFAILWFQIGDKPAIFLIFLASFFPLIISVISAVSTIPYTYFRVAKEYGFTRKEVMTKVTFPAIMPQLITSLRVCFGISWVVIIAAEMVGCQDGLGYAIWDARNGLNLEIAVCYMIVIGIIGILMDRIFSTLSKSKSLEWGYGKR